MENDESAHAVSIGPRFHREARNAVTGAVPKPGVFANSVC
jgi:hypothetical protein